MATSQKRNEDVYKMDSNPRGLCVIINNETFTGDLISNRTGTNIDKDKLEQTFTKLGFTIQLYDNCSCEEIKNHIMSAADDPKQSQYDCFVCCILSHGTRGKVSGVDGETVDIMYLKSLVKPDKCNNLVNKPKLFFIQACQDENIMWEYMVDSARSPKWLPKEADFLMCYSTSPGYKSLRHTGIGSPYIHCLTELLNQYADREDILEILVRVNKEVANMIPQEPELKCSLRKKLFLKPASHGLVPYGNGNESRDISAVSKRKRRYPDTASSATNENQPVNAVKQHHEQGDIITLIEASREGNTKKVQTILRTNPSIINKTDRIGWSGLHYASKNEHVNVINVLLEKGADINCQTKDEITSLLLASSFGHVKVVSFLLKHDADISKRDKKGRNALWVASHAGHTVVVSQLLKHTNDINGQNTAEQTPLWAACNEGHKYVVSYLLRHRAHINKPDQWGRTPLWIASFRGKTNVVRVLLDTKTVQINRQNTDGKTPLYIASGEGHTEIVSALLEHGADCSITDDDGGGPLFAAAMNGHPEIVPILLSSGADCNIKATEKYGTTPLIIAAKKGHAKVVETLLDKGAMINKGDNNGATALHFAAQEGHDELMDVLLDFGARVDCQSNEGTTPLQLACCNGRTKTVQKLLDHISDVNKARNKGHSPLRVSPHKIYAQVVIPLLDVAALVNHKNKQGITALYMASEKGHKEIVQLLLQQGATERYFQR